MANKTSRNKKLNSELSHALLNDMERLEYGFATYWKQITAVAVVLVIVVILAFWAVSARNRANREAAFALADAVTVEELTAALEQYSSAPGAAAARYRLVKLLIDAKDFEAAVRELRRVIEAQPAEPLLGSARVTEAYLYESMGKPEAAAKEFAALGTSMELSQALRAEANANAGRLFIQLKDLNQAASCLTRAANLVPDRESARWWHENARAMLIALEAGEYGPYTKAPTKL